uniref:Uncharacterized protein n=1 Tax=Arundo donax TaxID=35708 RepID=A0A0A8YTH5_ARUDO
MIKLNLPLAQQHSTLKMDKELQLWRSVRRWFPLLPRRRPWRNPQKWLWEACTWCAPSTSPELPMKPFHPSRVVSPLRLARSRLGHGRRQPCRGPVLAHAELALARVVPAVDRAAATLPVACAALARAALLLARTAVAPVFADHAAFPVACATAAPASADRAAPTVHHALAARETRADLVAAVVGEEDLDPVGSKVVLDLHGQAQAEGHLHSRAGH